MALGALLAVSAVSPRTRLGGRRLLDALVQAARASVPLITAAACVGVILGVVTLTGVGTRLPALILPLAQESLFPALLVIMVSSLVLGMGLPSSVCYLLLATLVGPVLGRLGVVPLAAHLFIFYFGMMSMVTPPVALAAYAASGLAGSSFWSTSLAAFRFALAGFALPYLFVYRPQLLMLAADGGPASVAAIALAVGLAVLGILPLAAAVAGVGRGAADEHHEQAQRADRTRRGERAPGEQVVARPVRDVPERREHERVVRVRVEIARARDGQRAGERHAVAQPVPVDQLVHPLHVRRVAAHGADAVTRPAQVRDAGEGLGDHGHHVYHVSLTRGWQLP